MKIEEAIVYLLAERGGGMKAEQIASAINARGLHIRKDGQPVSVSQVWWAVKHFSSVFVFAEWRIMLLM